MKLRVIQYKDHPEDYCVCLDEDGCQHRVDLVVSGDLGDMHPSELIGKTIEVSYLSPYVTIGHDVKITGDSNA